ncbi:MAG: hypothetical protein HQK89_11035 [Nitrospirae bacterium]|nr:hypothetical protein [Nitrospirota bacterium]
MNSIELYKELPKTNCGQCDERTCLAFAISVVKGSKYLNLCPFLQEDKLQRLSRSLKKVDITAGILETLRVETVKYNIEEIAGSIGARVVENGIEVRC